MVNALLFLSLVFKVPCYVFDSDGKKHDLNPLIKVTDGYLVDDSDDSVDFYINVCRNLGEYVSQPCPGSVLFLKKKLFKDCLSAAVGIGDIRHLYWRQKRIRNETRFFFKFCAKMAEERFHNGVKINKVTGRQSTILTRL